MLLNVVVSSIYISTTIVCKLHKLLVTVGSRLCCDGLALVIITACSASIEVGCPISIIIVIVVTII